MNMPLHFAELVAKSSTLTQGILERSGWYPERRIDILEYTHYLEMNGYNVFPVVKEFLSHFGELHIRWSFTHSNTGKVVYSDIRFNPVEAVKGIDPGWIQDYSSIIGQSLCPLGSASLDHELLTMDEEGRVYGAFNELFMLYGENGVQAVDSIVTRNNIFLIRDSYGNIINDWFRG